MAQTKFFEKDDQTKSPGLELVAFSRTTDPNSFAIGNNSSKLSIMSLRKIGNTPAYQLRKSFHEELLNLSKQSKKRTIRAITKLDPVSSNKSYGGGCAYLLNWFTNQIVYNQHTFDNIYDNSKKINVLDYIQEPIKLNNEENNIGLDMNENNAPNEKFVTPEKVSMVVNTHILHKKHVV